MYYGKNYIGGFREHRSDFESINPSTSMVLGCFPQSTNEEVDQAVNLAANEFHKWKSLSRVQRSDFLLKLCNVLDDSKEYVSKYISLETGKSLSESRAEVIEALHMAQYCFGKGREPCGEIVSSELAERDSFVIRKPKGVVAVVAPWNFPFAIGGFWCSAPALLEGNTVVFKPSELTPIVGQITAELYHNAGFPLGVFNLVHGDGNVGKNLVEHHLVNHIAFTGSVDVGREIRRICSLSEKTCSCEMGSKSAVIVFEDCDLDLAISACLNSAFKLSGQRCVSSGRLIVQRSIVESFKEKFIEKAHYFFMGGPNDPIPSDATICFGPVISKEQKQKIESYNKMVLDDSSAKVLLNCSSNNKQGYFIGPFIYECEWGDKPYLKQEVFGPHVAIVPFDDVQDAINIYNDTPYGLSLGAITNDFRIMRQIRNSCDAGMIYFNLGSIGAESHLPFTGLKMSGNGGSSAAGTFDTVVHKVAVSVNHARSINFPQGLK